MIFVDIDIFVVTSVINTGSIGWSYNYPRSIFTPDQRLQQTLKTIKSVREVSPDSEILFVEASQLSKDTLDMLKKRCDYMYYLGEDDETRNNCIKSNCKGLGDAWLIYKGIEYIKNKKIACRNIFKLSGRYRLNNNFNRMNISNDLITFRPVSSTICFSVPSSLIDLCLNKLLEATDLFKIRSDIGIETYLPELFQNKHIV